MPRLVALLTAPLFVIAACGDAVSNEDEESLDELAEDLPEDALEDLEEVEPAEDDELLDVVTVSDNVGEEPDVEIDGEIETDATVRRVIVEGEGDTFSDDAIADVDLVAYNGTTGEELADSSTYVFAPVPMPAAEMAFTEGFGEALLDVPLGSRIVAAIPELEGSGHPDLEEGDAVVVVMDLLEPRERGELPQVGDLESPRAEGESASPPDGLPEVTLDDDGRPSVEVPEGDPPEELVSELLIEGDGDEVPRGATILAQYSGFLWEDGSEFDSSWEAGEPVPFSLTEVIPGWTMALFGYPVGSQVLLVVPPDLAYGEMGQGEAIPPDATLVFVVDILATD